ncbi:calcium-binding protein [Caenimonas aquaedulcis]|uniref:DUF4214 domain-containing protein n=1 Tax=Caenimonas aquaedulcis TaxID=2793270 RepID=A0A931H1L1_9BURK|nr:hypothetical protein [Caenimonas aquaedulcis]MBG9386873.1 hypothetical protein [Caenimonas aquaedulcis]
MSFHLYQIDEIFSSADGTVQFIELAVGNFNGEHLLAGHPISVTSNGVKHTFTFPADLPSAATANTHVLIATQGFAALGIVTPDYVVPDGFLFTAGGTINYAGVDAVTYGALPGDGSHSISDTGTVMVASPTNFHGATGQLPTSTTFNGTEANDTLTGTSGNDVINGFGGNDSIAGAGGQDTVDGGSGTDTLVVQAADSAMTSLTAAHVAAAGIDVTLTGVERVSLTDKLVVFDTQPGDAAWQAMALLTAGFGQAGAMAQLDFWLGASHQGLSMPVLGQQLIDFYAPGVPNASLVAYLYNSIVGVAPDAATVDQYAGEIGAAKTFATQGDLLAFAANLSFNTDHMVGFVGSVPHLDHVAGGG